MYDIMFEESEMGFEPNKMNKEIVEFKAKVTELQEALTLARTSVSELMSSLTDVELRRNKVAYKLSVSELEIENLKKELAAERLKSSSLEMQYKAALNRGSEESYLLAIVRDRDFWEQYCKRLSARLDASLEPRK
jgi:peptidoglycan hydrolase CwlO-like protein